MKRKNFFGKIPTYKECVSLCEYDGSPFRETKHVVDGYNISTFDYRLAQVSDFTNPLKDNLDIKGNELRGLTFVFNKDGSLFKRYLMIEKFFNLNQTEESLYDKVKNYKVKNIYNKEDGSLASFIKLPNNKIIGKTKNGFTNLQCEDINYIYANNNAIKEFVEWSLNNDIIPLFEYVSPKNRIVLRYNNSKLVLLKLRNNKTGVHLDLNDYSTKDIETVEKENNNTLDSLINKAEYIENKEGWVVEFENGYFVKIKCAWYTDRHGLLTEGIYRENIIVKNVLDDKIDDIIGEIPQGEFESINKINNIASIVRKELNDREKEIIEEYNWFLGNNISKKEYAINHRKGNENFDFVMKMLTRDRLLNMDKNEILKNYKSVEDYNNTIENLKLFNLLKDEIEYDNNKLEKSRDWLSKRGLKLTL